MVENEGDKFDPPKSNQDKYLKLLKGAPSQLVTQTLNEQTNPNPDFIIPALYPLGHPLYRAPTAASGEGAAAVPADPGNPHPEAGQKDLIKIRTWMDKVWAVLIQQGQVRFHTYDNVNHVDEVEAANFVRPPAKGAGGRGKGGLRGRGARNAGRAGRGRSNNSRPPPFPKKELHRELDDRVVCFRCGGIGHTARAMAKDGTWIFCASMNQVDREKLAQVTYPHIANPFAERANEAEGEEEEPEGEEDAEFAGMDPDMEEMQMAAMMMDGDVDGEQN